MTFFETLEAAISIKGGPLCVGIDPRLERGPHARERLFDYAKNLVDACAPYAVAFKPQLAFFERHGVDGLEALNNIIAYIQEVDADFPIILDAKRGDIGSTAEAYAEALLDRPGSLAITLSPYLGKESVEPFLSRADQAAFLLCRTSNPGAGSLQEARLADGRPFYLALADEVLSWEKKPERPALGLVVAGNDSQALSAVRARHPQAWFLAPGIGAQGGNGEQAIRAGARADGYGVLISASRSISDAESPAIAAKNLRDSLNHSVSNLLASGSKKNQPQPPKRELSPLKQKMDKAERQEFFQRLFTVGAFQVGQFTLKSGQISPFYLDLRRISADPTLLHLAGRAYGELIKGLPGQHLAAIPVAALPLGTAAALSTGISLIYPRMEKKAHGSGAGVEGNWKVGEKAILLDDLISSGTSKREALSILQEAGLLIDNLVVLIERGTKGRKEMAQVGIQLHAWATIEDLLAAAKMTKYLTPKEEEKIRHFLQRDGANA